MVSVDHPLHSRSTGGRAPDRSEQRQKRVEEGLLDAGVFEEGFDVLTDRTLQPGDEEWTEAGPTASIELGSQLLRNDCQQKAHQLGLPMCVGLIEDVLQVSLNCGH